MQEMDKDLRQGEKVMKKCWTEVKRWRTADRAERSQRSRENTSRLMYFDLNNYLVSLYKHQCYIIDSKGAGGLCGWRHVWHAAWLCLNVCLHSLPHRLAFKCFNFRVCSYQAQSRRKKTSCMYWFQRIKLLQSCSFCVSGFLSAFQVTLVSTTADS